MGLQTNLLQDPGALGVLALLLSDQTLRGLSDGLVGEADQWVDLRGHGERRHTVSGENSSTASPLGQHSCDDKDAHILERKLERGCLS